MVEIDRDEPFVWGSKRGKLVVRWLQAKLTVLSDVDDNYTPRLSLASVVDFFREGDVNLREVASRLRWSLLGETEFFLLVEHWFRGPTTEWRSRGDRNATHTAVLGALRGKLAIFFIERKDTPLLLATESSEEEEGGGTSEPDDDEDQKDDEELVGDICVDWRVVSARQTR